MAVAVKTAQGQQRKAHRAAPLNPKAHSQKAQARQSFTVVKSLRDRTPAWLPAVIRLRKVSTPIAVGGVGLVLALYGMNVLLEREWGEKYAQLQSAQRTQGGLMLQTERQKYQIPLAVEAAPQNYVPQTQKNTLFLAPGSSGAVDPQSEAISPPELTSERLPIGY